MEKQPTVFSDFLVAGFILVVLPLWMVGFFMLINREVKAKTQRLRWMRLLRLPVAVFLFSVLPFKGISVASVGAFIAIAVVVFIGCYRLEAPGWTRDEKVSCLRSQLMQIGLLLAFLALGLLLIRFRFPDEPWN